MVTEIVTSSGGGDYDRLESVITNSDRWVIFPEGLDLARVDSEPECYWLLNESTGAMPK